MLVGVLLIIVVGSGVRYGGGGSAPDLPASCRTPALALSPVAVGPGGAVHYTAVGPKDLTVVLALDASELGPDLTATVQPGAQRSQVIRERKQLRGCRTTGVLGVQLPAGRHTVGLFRAAGGGPLVTTTLTVTAR